MKILLSGATGFVGRNLFSHLCKTGLTCYRLVRNSPRSKEEIYWDPYNQVIDLDALKNIDVFIHLSGANIADNFWTKNQKQVLIESRVKTTSFLSESIVKLKDTSKRLLVASAIGYYGPVTSSVVTEEGQKGEGFLATLCEDWEKSAGSAISAGNKTVFMRFGIVMGKDGGFLRKLIKVYRLGLGGVIGDKNAYISWIAIEDLCSAVHFLIMNELSEGVYNFVSPNPIKQKEFCFLLSKKLNRPAFFHIPGFIFRTFLGQMGREIFLANQRIYPERLIKEGFNFTYPDFAEYLDFVLNST